MTPASSGVYKYEMIKYITAIMALALVISCTPTHLDLTLAPDVAFKKANEEIEGHHFEDARQRLEHIIRTDTKYIYAPLAQLRLGDSYIESREPDLAIEEYRRFLDTYPRHKYASYAQYQIGLAYFGLVKGPDRGFGAALNALDIFTSLNETYPRNPYREDASLKIEQCNDIIAEHERIVGTFYFDRTAYHGAIDRLEGLVRDYPKYAEKSDVIMMLAVSYMGIGDETQSKQYLDRLESGFPDSKHLKKARKQIRKLRKLKE